VANKVGKVVRAVLGRKCRGFWLDRAKFGRKSLLAKLPFPLWQPETGSNASRDWFAESAR
jgi:hypothetical protein